MKKLFRGRRFKYGSVAILMTLLVLAAVIVLNTALSALAAGFGWYIDMSEQFVYGVGEDCEEYIEEKIFPLMSSGEKIRIILCDKESSLDDELSTRYVLGTVRELEEKYPDKIVIEHMNVWEDPKLARSYGVSSVSDVVFLYGDRHTTLSLGNFYVTSASDPETPTAYNGERRIAAALLRVVSENVPTCYFTLNHGEALDDSELLNLVADMGYNYAFIDLSKDDIPSDCELLLTVNPANDLFVSEGDADRSEAQKLEKYMSLGGKYMVFVSADTFVSGGLESFEDFLGEWGVNFSHSTGDDGIENTYLLRDTSNAVTVDSYTFFADYADNAVSKEIFGDTHKIPVVGAATVITPADGFKASGNGTFVLKDRVFSPIVVTNSSAEAWSGGYIVERANEQPFTLMSLTTQKCENGKTAYLYAGSSVEFCRESMLTSTVYGNSEALMSMVSHMGNDNIPTSLVSRPLATPPIQSLSTKGATIITVLLSTIPVLSVGAVGAVVLTRRKHS